MGEGKHDHNNGLANEPRQCRGFIRALFEKVDFFKLKLECSNISRKALLQHVFKNTPKYFLLLVVCDENDVLRYRRLERSGRRVFYAHVRTYGHCLRKWTF